MSMEPKEKTRSHYGPAACLFRVKLQFVTEDETLPVSPLRVDSILNVACQDVEQAIALARERVHDKIGEGRYARVVSVDLIEVIDVQ